MKKTFTLLLSLFIIGFIIPEDHRMPVKDATVNDWNSKSFWYYPWGNNRVHKGIDIFAEQGTAVTAPTDGFVLFMGENALGGNVVYMIGPKWRFHYFAHLQANNNKRFGFVSVGSVLGYVGTSGNAKGKSPHLHYSIKSIFPRLWKYDSSKVYSWNRLFYVDPSHYLIAGNKA
jgi:murein DD-endopeptidase MepM/ murein hydrolase activator NlpD